MMRQLLGALGGLALVIALAPSSRADEYDAPKRSKRTGAFREVWLDPGIGWWCPGTLFCDREQAACEASALTGTTCNAYKKVWAYSVFEWHPNGVTGTWMTYPVAKRSECESLRRSALKRKDRSSVSPCVAVGAKSTPWPKKPALWLPPGTGWWCLHFATEGQEYSSCDRFEVDCRSLSDTISSLEEKKYKGTRLLAPCRSQPKAWAYIEQVEGTDYYSFPKRATEADCVAEAMGTCKALP
jgi:hypothetical protein